ncbi:MAG: hypothetical protein ACI9G1_004759 [Pirellulaceae bacterium]|jgi:hypothetical protein
MIALGSYIRLQLTVSLKNALKTAPRYTLKNAPRNGLQVALALTCCLSVLFGTAALSTAFGDGISVLPGQLKLQGPQATHRLLVLSMRDGDFAGQVSEGVKWQSSNEAVVKIQSNEAIPVGNGTATVTALVGNQSASTTVEVSDMDVDHQWSFRSHVQAVLTKHGCNSGACHGTLAGKGGFKLSLRGYDTTRDYHTITKQARGRRVELNDPGRSLLLAKPSGAIPHKGGVRFEVDSKSYRVLADWIVNGAPAPNDKDASLLRIEVLPERSVLKRDDQQQILVRAHYSDGRIEDVTQWAKFNSSDESVCRVDEQGKVDVIGFGEGAITAWFASKIVIARITSPYENIVDDEVFEQSPKRNFIDELVSKQLRRLNLPPSPRSTDAEFIRRAYIDTIGTLPTADEVTEFLGDQTNDKRDKLIEQLLSRKEFVDFWAYKWSDVLTIDGTRLRPDAVKAFYQWVRQRVENNTPWDHFVRQVLTAKGSSLENGATNFYALHQDPENMTENACQAFLGLSIACAKCHNHPLEKWTNDQYYAMANMFSRVRAKGWGGDPRNGDGKRTVYVVNHGELVQPLTGKPQPPTPLDGKAIEFTDPTDRREYLADWMTSRDNPYFSRSIANRVWANFFGVGLVESIDDMRDSNPCSNDELLHAIADHLADNKFDLKSLMKSILQSETYQRSSLPIAANKNETRFYSRYYPRRLMAEVLLDAISQVTDVPTTFDEVLFPGSDRKKTDFYPKGTRAIQLYDSAVSSYFLKTFGRNQRRITCECERSDEPTMVQVLHISNGKTINDKLTAKENRVEEFLKEKLGEEEMIRRVYLCALSRLPTDAERKQLLATMEGAPQEEKRVVVEDLFWAVMSSREFLFNH